MQTITLKERVGADGILRLNVPVEAKDRDVEVVVVIGPANGATNGQNGEIPFNGAVKTTEETDANGWPIGFFERTAGAWQGDLERPAQPPEQERTSWD